MGIPLEETNLIANVPVDQCTKHIDMRSYRILFLLPIWKSNLSSETLSDDDRLLQIKEYAKPFDVVVTLAGFLFSVVSSTSSYTYCTSKEWEKVNSQNMSTSSQLGKISFFKAMNGSKPIQQVVFQKDDAELNDSEKSKIRELAQSLKNVQENYQILLVHKTNTSGDIAYQTRLMKKRSEEIRAILSAEAIDLQRVQTVFTEKEIDAADTVSVTSIYLAIE
ncbi:OmpA family protein [Leptospira ryugenii]|nr:OmpA family protein [Leptospira ryugenii]